MMLDKLEVQSAVTTLAETASVGKRDWDDRIRDALPVLKQILAATAGWRIWVRAALAMVIAALEAYLDLTGGEP